MLFVLFRLGSGGVDKLPAVLDLHTTKQGEQPTRPCSESEMGRYNSASEGHRFSTRIARRIAEKAARQLEQQSEKVRVVTSVLVCADGYFRRLPRKGGI